VDAQDIAFSSMIAEWFGAIGTVLAFGAAVVIYGHGQHMDNRRMADDLSSTVHSGLMGGEDRMTHLYLSVTNNGSTAIEAPYIYVPLGIKHPGVQELAFHEHSAGGLKPNETQTKIMKVAYPLQYAPRVFIKFRDSRNRTWFRYVHSAKYIRGVRKWAFQRRVKRARIIKTNYIDVS
jgi:hypothetical protein